MRVFHIDTVAGAYRPLDTQGQLHDLQGLVGGFIEVVRLPEFEQFGILLLVNEEGLLAQLEVNENLWPYFLVGPVVALAESREDFTGLSDFQEDFIKQWLEQNWSDGGDLIDQYT